MVDAPALSDSNGAVRGVRVGESDRYLSIPYAAPPFDPRRFRPPEPAVPCDGDPGWERWSARRPVQAFDADGGHIDCAPRADELAGPPAR